MRHPRFAALLAPFVLAASAQAADLPRGSAPPPDYYAPPPAFSWQGFYLGIHAGYGFSAFRDGNFNVVGHPRTLFGSPNGGLVGFTGGYNYVVVPNFLLGLEADFAFTGMKASQMPFFGLASQGTVDDLFTLRARAGYTIERALLYLTGGFAGSRNTVQITDFVTGFSGQQSKFQTGWALGGGLEFLVTNNLSAKAEYIFTSVGSDRYFDFSTYALQSGVNTSTVKGGLNYHF